jgi:hypothetical protein
MSGSPGHQWRCHFPVGTPEGEAALARNRDASITAAGLQLTGTRA